LERGNKNGIYFNNIIKNLELNVLKFVSNVQHSKFNNLRNIIIRFVNIFFIVNIIILITIIKNCFHNYKVLTYKIVTVTMDLNPGSELKFLAKSSK